MYECLCCGNRFSRPRPYRDMQGEYWGTPAETVSTGCPLCGGSYADLTGKGGDAYGA